MRMNRRTAKKVVRKYLCFTRYGVDVRRLSRYTPAARTLDRACARLGRDMGRQAFRARAAGIECPLCGGTKRPEQVRCEFCTTED